MPKLKLPDPCTYCGKPGSSHEHIIGDWVKKYLPRKDRRYGITRATADRSNPAVPRLKSQQSMKNGDLGTRKFRRVCRKCNNEWLSKIQQTAEPLLGPIISGHWPTQLDIAPAQLVAQWTAMTAINIACSGPKPMQEVDCRHFHEHRTPPSHWRIFVGRSDGNSLNFMHRYGDFAEMPEGSACSVQHSADAITIKIGLVTLHVVAITPNTAIRLDEVAYSRSIGMMQLFPAAAAIELSGTRLLSMDELNKVGNGLIDTVIMQIQKFPIPRYEWPL
ncbi:hypothetical protein [Bradyrhizobium sp. RT10b]|uniref:hypothetical protein n=1 Tax=Bradyrhizobium sp. RT10b TaxID=3156331 RepID=UPI003396499E